MASRITATTRRGSYAWRGSCDPCKSCQRVCARATAGAGEDPRVRQRARYRSVPEGDAMKPPESAVWMTRGARRGSPGPLAVAIAEAAAERLELTLADRDHAFVQVLSLSRRDPSDAYRRASLRPPFPESLSTATIVSRCPERTSG